MKAPGIPMLLWCPECGTRHVDGLSHDGTDWALKPHHTHACQECGCVWRPAIVNTIGMKHLPGFKNAVVREGDDMPGRCRALYAADQQCDLSRGHEGQHKHTHLLGVSRWTDDEPTGANERLDADAARSKAGRAKFKGRVGGGR